MPSKPVENMPASAPLAAEDLVHVAQWNGAGFDSRKATLAEVSDYASTAGAVSFATAAEFRAGVAAAKALAPKAAFDAAVPVALAITAGAVALDLSTGFNFTLSMTGDAELSTPSNVKPGQTGCIEITQDGTGTRLLTYAAGYVFADAVAPALSTAPGSLDLLFYQVLASGAVFLTPLQKAVA